MKRHAWLWMGCLFGALPLPAQENVKEEHVETLSADSLITGDARMDSLYRNLPEVLVVGERPVVKASAGKLEYDLPRMIRDRPVDNVFEGTAWRGGTGRSVDAGDARRYRGIGR